MAVLIIEECCEACKVERWIGRKVVSNWAWWLQKSVLTVESIMQMQKLKLPCRRNFPSHLESCFPWRFRLVTPYRVGRVPRWHPETCCYCCCCCSAVVTLGPPGRSQIQRQSLQKVEEEEPHNQIRLPPLQLAFDRSDMSCAVENYRRLNRWRLTMVAAMNNKQIMQELL